MLINPNLYIDKDKLIYDGYGSGYNNGVYITTGKLEEGKTYTLSCKIERTSIGNTFIDKSVNIGPCRSDGSTIHDIGYTFTDISNGEVVYTFTYRKEINSIWVFTNQGDRPRVKGVYTNIKIEEGRKPTPYIPNKNSVKADNQAVFLSGGYSRRFIQDRKRGGAIC
ncbi:hypothetical protein [Anaerococcus hydrogenalis]|uniref:hypothetical protein n=1 Tax=Anaerococcus hydrogenalis TaxID=33029 RepID=UPI001D2BB6DB|nr:hypothetical protein [Anaerococcus hydrogenalis]MBS5989558.1 hypothetical protein [Anaerococcus hydrogenalis]